MKNKEIVKRLRDSLDYEFDLSFNERKELLSYIEQLENTRDKAIEYIEEGRYEEFITMFKFAPRMCYTLYDKAEDEIEKITKEKDHYKHLYSEVKKQKDDVVEYINSEKFGENFPYIANECQVKSAILRMLGEIDEI